MLGNSDYVLLGKTAGQSESVGADPYAVFPGNGSLCLFPDPKQAAVDAVVFYGSLCSECDFPGQDGNCGDRCAGGGASGSGGLYEIRRRILDESNPGRRARRPLRPGHSASGDF